MNRYAFEEIFLGQTERFTVTVSEEMMQKFFEVTGDASPIHRSDEAAKARGYAGRVVYGMLSAGLFSTLAGVHLPGERCLLHSVTAKFAKPVYIGDTLTVTGRVQEKNDTFRTVTIKATITNQHGEKVTRGQITAGVQ